MALIQLHHKYRDGSTDFVAQIDAKTDEEVREWHDKIRISHPLPDEAIWLMCFEGSPYFVKEKDMPRMTHKDVVEIIDKPQDVPPSQVSWKAEMLDRIEQYGRVMYNAGVHEREESGPAMLASAERNLKRMRRLLGVSEEE